MKGVSYRIMFFESVNFPINYPSLHPDIIQCLVSLCVNKLTSLLLLIAFGLKILLILTPSKHWLALRFASGVLLCEFSEWGFSCACKCLHHICSGECYLWNVGNDDGLRNNQHFFPEKNICQTKIPTRGSEWQSMSPIHREPPTTYRGKKIEIFYLSFILELFQAWHSDMGEWQSPGTVW